MATKVLYGIHSTAPGLEYELYAEQTGGSGNSRTIKLTLKLRVAGSVSSEWFGYAMDHRFNVNGSWSEWYTTKGTETWNGTQSFRSWSYSKSVDVGTTSSKAITVGFQTDGKNSSGSWDTTKTGNFTVGSTNTAPYFDSTDYVTFKENNSSGATITAAQSGTENSKKIGENVSAIYLSWPSAHDKEGGTLTYEVWNEINGGSWSKIGETTSTNYTHNIGSGNEGRAYDYYVKAKDSTGAISSSCNGTQFQKNTFTNNTLSSTASISYATTSVSFLYAGAANTTGNTSFTTVLGCDGITVYNGTVTSSPISLAIYKSGTVPSGPYIKFDDLKSRFSSNNYIGTVNFTLKTTNAYGTSKVSNKNISVDLRTQPNPASNQEISTSTSESTIYKKVTTGNYYYLPDGSGVARVKWSAGSGKLDESITYEVYVAYGTGSWQKLTTLPSSTLYYNHVIPKQTNSQQFKYLIRTITGYGYYSDVTTPAKTLDYYNTPGITVGTITRSATTADVKVTIRSNSSIPNINTVGTWSTSPATSSGSLTSSQTEQNIPVTNLTDNGSYTLSVIYKDDTGFSSNATKTISIGPNAPAFFVNKYGAGVGGVKASSSAALNVQGDLRVNDTNIKIIRLGTEDLDTIKTQGEYEQHSNANTSVASHYPENLAGHLTVTVGAGVQQRYHVYNSSRVYIRAQYSTGAWTDWAKMYNTINRPSAGDISAIGHAVDGLTYHGMNIAGNAGVWIRTTSMGLLPYQSGSTSSLGTSAWRFANIFGTELDCSGVGKIGDLYITGSQSYIRNSGGSVFVRHTTDGNTVLSARNTTGNAVYIRPCGDTSTTSQLYVGPSETNIGSNTNVAGNISATGYINVTKNGDNIKLRPTATSNSCYIKFYDHTSTQRCFLGFPTSNSYNMHLGSNTASIILRGNYIGCRNSDDNGYVPCRASSFDVNSEEKWKTNIIELGRSGLDIINEGKIYEYDMISDGSHKVGLVIDRETPAEVITVMNRHDDFDNKPSDESGALLLSELPTEPVETVDLGVDLYSMTAISWKAIQELNQEIVKLKAEILELKTQNGLI